MKPTSIKLSAPVRAGDAERDRDVRVRHRCLHPLRFTVNTLGNQFSVTNDQVMFANKAGINAFMLTADRFSLMHSNEIKIVSKAGAAGVNVNAAGTAVTGSRILLG